MRTKVICHVICVLICTPFLTIGMTGNVNALVGNEYWTDTGECEFDRFGYSVASAGDVNGDGYNDVIVGAETNDDVADNAGKAYVYHGSSSGLSTNADWSVTGEGDNDYLGQTVASAGDVNGDGYDDVVVCAYRNDDGGLKAGKVYVYHGSSAGLSTTDDWNTIGEGAYDSFGVSAACAGDVNGDGYDDIIVGAPFNRDAGSNAGKAYVYHGSSTGLSTSYDWNDKGENATDYFGYSVASAGDVNGDGYYDVIVGAESNNDGGDSAGKVYVYLGSLNGLSPTPAWTKTGEDVDNIFGRPVAPAGDVNGDGYDDVIIAAYRNDEAGELAGKVYVYKGSSTGLSTNPTWTEIGEGFDEYFGFSIASAGDVNGDGYSDIIIGTYKNDDAGHNAGKAYVYLGSSVGLSSAPSWTETGEYADDMFGHSVASAGDVNGNGNDEVIIGAYRNDDNGNEAGKVYVYDFEFEPSIISTSIDIDPDTLNLKSKGRWITCYITLNNPYNVNDIDIGTVILEDTIPTEWGDIQNGTLMVKFDRSEVEDMLTPGTYNLKVSGELLDGTLFEGYSDEIRVIEPP